MANKNKLEDCEVCGATKARYTCPKCEVRTCSLTCVNIHKKELECDGIRDPTKFIPLKSFTDLDLLSDYRFLEQVGRSIDTKKRNPELKYINYTNLPVHLHKSRNPELKYTHQANLPVHLHKLRYAAFRRKMSLLFMPQVLSRHKENTTYLNWKTDELFWRLEWIFPQAENMKYTVDRALDSIRLSTLVEQVLDPVTDETDIEKLNAKLLIADKLQFYRAAGLTNIKILLKAEKIKNAQSKFYDLDLTLTLKENLENKTIVEFPTLHVVMKDHYFIYDIIDTDEESSDAEYTDYRAKKRHNNNGPNSNKKYEKVNYFFNDFSSSDDEDIDNKIKRKRGFQSLNLPSYEELIKISKQFCPL